MNCPRCNAQIEDGSSVCPQCQAKIVYRQQDYSYTPDAAIQASQDGKKQAKVKQPVDPVRKKRRLTVLVAVILIAAVIIGAYETRLIGPAVRGHLRDGVLTVDGEGPMDNYNPDSEYSGDYQPWYRHLDEIEKIVIEPGVTTIGYGAFDFCGMATEVIIPDTVTIIGDRAFYICSSLPSVEIPHSVTWIGEDAFGGCEALTEVTVPGSVSRMGKGIFGYCFSLERAAVEEGVTALGEQMFSWCESLQSVTIPASVTRIGRNAFEGCGALTDVYYAGTERQWLQIVVESGNEPLLEADIHYLAH